MLITLLLAFQLTGVFLSSTPVRARTFYPSLPQFAATDALETGGFPNIDDPLLFATANWNGFSGPAWMAKRSTIDVFDEELPAPRFLSFDSALKSFAAKLPSIHSLPGNYHVSPAPIQLANREITPRSSVRFEGAAAKRGLLQPIELPPEYYSDILESSIVQVLIDRDGSVVSARLLDGSGLRKADQDAVALAAKARFAPASDAPGSDGNPIAFGKLIFDWIAVTSPSTR